MMRTASKSLGILAAALLAAHACALAEGTAPATCVSARFPTRLDAKSVVALLKDVEAKAAETNARVYFLEPGTLVIEGSPEAQQTLTELVEDAIEASGGPPREVPATRVMTLTELRCQLEEGIETIGKSSDGHTSPTTFARALDPESPEMSATRVQRLREHEAKIRALIDERKRAREAAASGNPVPPPAAAVPVAGTSVYTGQKSGKLVTVGMNEGKIEQVAMIIGAQIGTSVDVYGGAVGRRVTIIAQDKTLEDTLDSLTAGNGLVWWKREDGGYGICDKAYYESSVLPGTTRLEVYTAKGTKAPDLQRMLTELNLLSPNGRSSVDADNNRVAVTDTPAAHKAIREAIAKLEGGATGKPD